MHSHPSQAKQAYPALNNSIFLNKRAGHFHLPLPIRRNRRIIPIPPENHLDDSEVEVVLQN